MRTPVEILPDGEVTLRRWRVADAEALRRAVSGSLDHLAPWMPWAVDGYGESDAAAFLALTRKKWESGEAFEYAILGAGEEVAGSCGLMARIGPGGLEIGYWLAKPRTGRGWATRAARLLTAEAFRMGADRVEIVHDVANERSAAVPRRLGFAPVGRSPAQLPGGTASTGTILVWRLLAPATGSV